MSSLTENKTRLDGGFEKETMKLETVLTRITQEPKNMSDTELRDTVLKFAKEFQALLDLRRYLMQLF